MRLTSRLVKLEVYFTEQEIFTDRITNASRKTTVRSSSKVSTKHLRQLRDYEPTRRPEILHGK